MAFDVSPQSFVIKVSTTAPTLATTTTLLDTTSAFGVGVFRHTGIKRISFGVVNDQAGTLIAQKSIDGGTTWDTYDSRVVGIPAANTMSGPFDYLVDTFLDWRLRWTNGGVTQTTWRPEMHGHENREPGT